MEPWIQPTTAPHQPDVADDDQSVDQEVRVERGWMEDPQPAPETWVVSRHDSFGITAFTAAVVFGFLFLVIVAFPFLLLATY